MFFFFFISVSIHYRRSFRFALAVLIAADVLVLLTYNHCYLSGRRLLLVGMVSGGEDGARYLKDCAGSCFSFFV